MNLVLRMAILTVGMFVASAGHTADRPLQDFYGEFQGKSVAGTIGSAEEGGEIAPRTLNVSILPHDEGFTLGWMTISTKASGKTKAKFNMIDFVPTNKPNIFRSAMRRDSEGRLVPMDPLSGDPYVWASIENDTMKVHAIEVTDSGGYEVQIYERTLTEAGMDLKFQRFEDGVLMREVVGILNRVGK